MYAAVQDVVGSYIQEKREAAAAGRGDAPAATHAAHQFQPGFGPAPAAAAGLHGSQGASGGGAVPMLQFGMGVPYAGSPAAASGHSGH